MSKLTFGRSSNSVSIQRTSCLHRGGNSHNNIIAKLYEYRSAPTDGESFFFTLIRWDEWDTVLL